MFNILQKASILTFHWVIKKLSEEFTNWLLAIFSAPIFYCFHDFVLIKRTFPPRSFTALIICREIRIRILFYYSKAGDRGGEVGKIPGAWTG